MGVKLTGDTHTATTVASVAVALSSGAATFPKCVAHAFGNFWEWTGRKLSGRQGCNNWIAAGTDFRPQCPKSFKRLRKMKLWKEMEKGHSFIT